MYWASEYEWQTIRTSGQWYGMVDKTDRVLTGKKETSRVAGGQRGLVSRRSLSVSKLIWCFVDRPSWYINESTPTWYTFLRLFYWQSMPLQVSGVTRSSSGGSAQMLFGVIAYVGCVLTTCRLRWKSSNLHAVNTHPTHTITPNSNCAEHPEDGRVTPETCRGIDC
jgi:hypothetical protein